MRWSVEYAGLTDAGRVRQTNEDNWLAVPEQGVFVVADGMGGQRAGGLASEAAVATLPSLVLQALSELEGLPKGKAARRMANAIATLSKELCRQTRNEPGLVGMGLTVVRVVARVDHLLVGHMGDSRAYRLRDGKLKQLTADHSVIQLFLDCGEISAEEAASHPARGQLTCAVGMEGEPLSQTRLLKLKGEELLLTQNSTPSRLVMG